MSKEESGFTGGGFQSMPSLYQDEQRIHNVSNWPQSMLEDRMKEYTKFLQQDSIMPRAQQTGLRLLGMMSFELSYRSGGPNSLLRGSK